jgi:hypothetical protein
MNEDELLDRLRAAAAEADPPPEHVLAAARGAFARVGLEGELLELQFDSSVDAATAGARSGAGRRLLRFEAADRAVELQLLGPGPVGVVGQVTPATADGVELAHTGGVARADTDDLGRFTLDAIPRGPVSLAWTAPDGSRVRTSWVAI